MNQDTIPSQLGPVTVPSTLGSDTASEQPARSSAFSPALKWTLVGAAILLVWHFAT